MYYIDIIILLIIILIIVILIYDVYKKNIKIIKKIEMFNDYDFDKIGIYDKLGPIKFIDKDDPLHVLGYFPNGEGENGTLSAEQLQIIKDKGLSMTTIRVPRGTTGPPGERGETGEVGNVGPQGDDGKNYIGPPGKNGADAPACKDGKDAPECLPGEKGVPGNNAKDCVPGEKGKQGNPADQCEPCAKGAPGEDADPCVSHPSPGSPGGAQHGEDAKDCNCKCDPCEPAQCEDTVDLKQINGTKLVINTNNIDINETLNMNNGSQICFGNTCINKDTIDRINNM